MKPVSRFTFKPKPLFILLFIVLFLGHAGYTQSLSQSTTYTAGNIGVKWYLSTLVEGPFDPGTCLKSLTITLPTDEDYYTVTSFDVEYQMIARNGAYKGSQRSKIRCQYSNSTSYTEDRMEIIRSLKIRLSGLRVHNPRFYS